MTPERRAELRKLREAATPGKWHRCSGPWVGLRFGVVSESNECIAEPREYKLDADKHNAALIAAAVNALVPLLDALDAAEKRVAELEAELGDHDSIAVAFIQDRCEQYVPSSGCYDALCELTARFRRGEHREAYKHGELDDLLEALKGGT